MSSDLGSVVVTWRGRDMLLCELWAIVAREAAEYRRRGKP